RIVSVCKFHLLTIPHIINYRSSTNGVVQKLNQRLRNINNGRLYGEGSHRLRIHLNIILNDQSIHTTASVRGNKRYGIISGSEISMCGTSSRGGCSIAEIPNKAL